LFQFRQDAIIQSVGGSDYHPANFIEICLVLLRSERNADSIWDRSRAGT